MLKSYTELIDKHKGENAFICGAGLSFFDCMSHKDFNKIHDHVVVSVNSSFIAMPWKSGSPDKRYWISNDALVRRWSYWEDLKASNCTKIVRDSWSAYFDEIPDFYQFSPRPTPENEVNENDRGLCYCSSVPSALDLCLQMGCNKIFLLGVDHYFDPAGRSHFWQFLPYDQQPKRNDGRLASHFEQILAFSYNDKAYPALKKLAESWDRQVINCSPLSLVSCFFKMKFEKALSLC